MPDAIAADDGSGKYVAFGRAILTNPGDSILYLHSIETGTNSGMYDYNIDGLTNNSSADLGYKPNTDANDPVLSISIQGVDGDIHGTGGTPSFSTKYSFYTEYAADTNTVGNSSRWYSSNPTTYYKNLGRQNAVGVLAQSTHIGIDTTYITDGNYSYENLKKDAQAGWGYGTWYPNTSTGIELFSSCPPLETDTLTTLFEMPMTGSPRISPTIDIKMEIPAATDSADSYGNYQSWMRVVFMPADYYNHRYYSTANSVFESLSATDYDTNGIRLYESIYLFKTTVADTAQIITADVEGDAAASGATIDFGNISVG
jgi:hypothetical protein